MFRLTRYLVLIGIPTAVAIVVLFTVMFRVIATNDLVYQSENHNRIVSKTLSNVLWPLVRGYRNSILQEDLSATNSSQTKKNSADMMKNMLDEPMFQLLQGTDVLKIKIFNLDNSIVYSTDSSVVTNQQPEIHTGFQSAKQGKIVSHIEFRNFFMSWNKRKLVDRYVVSSYMPLRNTETNEIEAVFETYSDATELYAHLNDNLSRFTILLSAISFTLFFLVLFIVRRLDKTISNNSELSLAHNNAKEANMAKSRLLANMSHELRTPLNAIIGYSELIEEESEDGDDYKMEKDVGKIKSAGKHLLRLINEILDLSKIEAGEMTTFYETIYIPKMMRDVDTIIQPLISRNNNEYSITCNDDLYIKTDLTKLRQIIINLLSNSAKFCQNGQVNLQITQDKAGLQFNVKDNGIGMTEIQVQTLFTPFVQADDSTTRRYGGSGLGLAISKQFCEMLDGSISVESKLGHGTSFTVYIPDSECRAGTLSSHQNPIKRHAT